MLVVHKTMWRAHGDFGDLCCRAWPATIPPPSRPDMLHSKPGCDGRRA